MNTLNPLDQDIIKKFDQNFSHIKQKPVVLYGSGEKTGLILDHCKNFNFVGIMDRQRQGMCYGLPVLEKSEVIEKAYCIILICAIPNIEIIYNRIQGWTSENNIPVYHLNGTQLKPVENAGRSLDLLCSLDEYKEKILSYDIISFDVFDTLIMRYTLYPDDIFELMHKQLESLYPDNNFSEFVKMRKKAEQICFEKRNCAYTLINIYEEYIRIADIDKSWIYVLAGMEFKAELMNVLPRKDVVELLRYAKESGKIIILTSDMYLSEQQISLLLEKCCIDPEIFDRVFISNECSASKHSGQLWKIVSKEYRDKKIIHFGDNEISDGQKAVENKISYLPIYSSIKLAISLFDNKWTLYENSLECRMIMGIFISDILNSPFKLDPSGKIKIESTEKIGYNFFGPVVKCFMDILYKQAKEKEQKIVFQARDCWILKNLADKYYTEYDVKSVYFLTSRRAIALASIKNESDIRQVCKVFMMNTEHSFKRFCEVVFNITTDDLDTNNDIIIKNTDKELLTSHIIKCYSEKILSESSRQRKYFFDYVDKLDVKPDEPLAMINFVGSGTTQLFFQNTGFNTTCEYYYFATNLPRVDADKLKNINPVFGESSNFTGLNNNIAERTIFGECVFTSPQSQFMGFGKEGEYVFAESGINTQFDRIKDIHNGIDRYVGQFKNCNAFLSKESASLINIIYGYLFDKNIFVVPAAVREAFRLSDTLKSDDVFSIWS